MAAKLATVLNLVDWIVDNLTPHDMQVFLSLALFEQTSGFKNVCGSFLFLASLYVAELGLERKPRPRSRTGQASHP